MKITENRVNDSIRKYYGPYGDFQGSNETRPTVFIEIRQKHNSASSKRTLQTHVDCLLRQKKTLPSHNPENTIDFKHIPELRDHVDSIQVCYDSQEPFCVGKSVRVDEVNLEFRIYQLNSDGPGVENVDDSTNLAAATHWILPSVAFHNSWENLVYDSSIKSQLLGFAATTLLFSDHKVDTNIISWNKVVLLHGPPGTGKTSLCRALAHKLSIHLNHRYSYGQLIEVNSHSLFSKWFSESGKLVMKMFEKIQEFIDDPEALVFVLIDEVESLAHARKTVMAGSDPSDAIRVVNAVLTQIDAIKQYPNVMILTTSNVTGAIDLAFVDRADIKQYIGLPSPAAIFRIYDSCIQELIRAGIIYLPKRECNRETKDATEAKYLQELQPIAELSKGLSGRTLRKLPFLAHALYIHKSNVSLSDFLKALNKAVNKHFQELQELLKDQTNL